MNDRRSICGPPGGTTAPVFQKHPLENPEMVLDKPVRTRNSNSLRKIFLKTGVTPSASGSAYLELGSQSPNLNLAKPSYSSVSTSGVKLICTVHGPRPLPRSAPFTPTIILTTHIKYAPFASRQRHGYVRDASERDLALHLETALRGVIIGDRWPKSGVEVIITILEGEEDRWHGEERGGVQDLSRVSVGPWGMMSVLSGCITVASAAIVDAGIDCVDMVSGGVAALVRDRQGASEDTKYSVTSPMTLVLDPVPSEHYDILAACVVGYLPSRDEITDLWIRGDIGVATSRDVSKKRLSYEELTDSAVQAALGAHNVLTAATKELVEMRFGCLDGTSQITRGNRYSQGSSATVNPKAKSMSVVEIELVSS